VALVWFSCAVGASPEAAEAFSEFNLISVGIRVDADFFVSPNEASQESKSPRAPAKSNSFHSHAHYDCLSLSQLIQHQPAESSTSNQLNNMKTTKLIIATLGLGLTHALAGDVGQPVSGAAIEIRDPAPSMGCFCFDGNYLEFGSHASYTFSSDAALDGEPGLGLSLGYFFNDFIGVQASYTAIFASSTVHDTAGSLVARYPINDHCFAPYVYGGGGYAANSPSQSTGHLGAGLDWRVWELINCIGFFVDYRYTFADKSSDWQSISAGIKINF